MAEPTPFSELLMLSTPYSGTTALAKLLLSSERLWSRVENAEGQRLAEAKPFMPVGSWQADEVVDWPALKAVWEHGRPAGKILLEKSPWILLHAHGLVQTWPRAFFIISTRHPLAILPSILLRRSSSEDVISAWAIRWRQQSRALRQTAERFADRSIVTTYASFAREPRALLDRLEVVFGPLGIDPDTLVKVKKYDPAPISDHDARRIAKLSPRERELAEALLRGPRIAQELAFWGFDPSGPDGVAV